jgi:hypothetical protein
VSGFKNKSHIAKQVRCPMAEENLPTVDNKQRYALEFWLVVIMIGVLCLLVAAVLFWPINLPSAQVTGKETTFKDLLEYRTNILSVIITAFGAWVGAGAAYFFGRENLRVAADSLLAMRDLSPRERLRRTSIKQIPPTPLDWTVKKTTAVKDVWDKLTSEPTRWFIPIVRDDGALEGVINEEAIWRFLLDAQEPPAQPAAPPIQPAAPPAQPTAPPAQPAVPPAQPPAAVVAEKTVADILTFLEEKKLGRFQQIHVTVALGMTVGAATDLMDSKHVFLAIVETDGKPTHFFTTSEVRKLLLTGE